MPDGDETSAVPEFYIDGYGIQAHQYTVELAFTLAQPAQDKPRTVAIVRMSPEHAKVMAMLFRRNIKDWEKQFGVEISIPPKVLETHEIDLERDW